MCVKCYKDTNKRGKCQIYLSIFEHEYLNTKGKSKGSPHFRRAKDHCLKSFRRVLRIDVTLS